MLKFKGLVAASFTPMRADGSIALDKVPELVSHALKHKLSALFVNGTTGEFAALSFDERIRLAEAFLKSAKGKLPIIVHAGSASVDESANLARHACDNGADAVATLAPFYFRPGDIRALVEALKTVAAVCAPLPFYFYHIPSLTGVNFRVYEMLPLLLEEIPNFAGVKFTNEDLMDYQRSVDFCGNRAQIMFGRDEILLAGLALGAEAAVGSTYNFAPRIYQRILDAFAKGNLAEARHWQERSQALISFLPRYGFGVQKVMMKLAGVDVGPARQPVTNLTPAVEKELCAQLTEVKLLELIG
ncbi:MAG: dihydrodipicolinate synthase family protein [Victivallales bacterium]|jgi:N-acetylneuraminate lyase